MAVALPVDWRTRLAETVAVGYPLAPIALVFLGFVALAFAVGVQSHRDSSSARSLESDAADD
ncbi:MULTISPECIES: hypothetical protein [Natrialbaceae]|uniref:hypothetical protein n=1 Tax=Natrialbaceae TaxID=1644061 RepID=UPI00207D15FE|nr:hypothetical protein [Natronococcus sp. CG52]